MTTRGIRLGFWGAIPVWLAAMFMRPLHEDGAEHVFVRDGTGDGAELVERGAEVERALPPQPGPQVSSNS